MKIKNNFVILALHNANRKYNHNFNKKCLSMLNVLKYELCIYHNSLVVGM